MNSKVAAVWIVIFVVVIVIGIIGAANQDVLVNEDEEQPIYVKLDNAKECTKKDDAKSIAYEFAYNDDSKDLLRKLVITYNLNYPSHELYEAAVKICGSRTLTRCPNKLDGVTTILRGTETDFVMILDIEPSKVKPDKLTSYEKELKALELVITNETSISKYQEKLPVVNDVKYTCAQ